MMVDTRPLKGLAVRILPSDSVLRRVLKSEPDEMEARDYLAKLGTWLLLLREETPE
ncbi:MAG: hypothetical protein JRN16_03790 [Nitrososphaerota archaeon]|nr:hypothetical protein [Nitrososphaerota archaeon]